MKNGIDRRTFLGIAALGTAALGRTISRSPDNAGPPNVLVIQSDQHLGTVMSCAGDEIVKTPNLDRLASEGIRFTNCASCSPVCSPFRGTVQTGLYPHKHGVVRNGLPLDRELPCFAESFAEAGYATGYIGKWHLDGFIPKPESGNGVTKKAVGGYVVPERRQGWQEWNGYEKAHEFFEVWKFDNSGRKTRVHGYDWEPTWHTDMALDFAKRNRDNGKPWLYYLAYGPPHKPEQCPQEFLNLYDPGKFELSPDIDGKLPAKLEASLREAIQVYYGQVTAIDHEIGRLLEGLKTLGIDENTVILYTSDHGDRLGSHWLDIENGGEPRAINMRGKSSPYAKAFRIPLIIRWPNRIKSGQVCDQMVGSVDLTPTILELAEIEPIPQMQGDSMAGWCLKGDGPKNEAVWIGLGNWRAVWDGRYVYARGSGFNHLFDHSADPHELTNLIDSREARREKLRLHKLLIELSEKAEDPMLPKLKTLEV